MAAKINQPLLSICCITYNHKNYISNAIDSFLMQKTNFSVEICIGEDDSTDGTREICKKYATKYPEKIRLFLRNRSDKIFIEGHETGRYNFIETLKKCKGKYIALCDGDDFWIDPLKLQKQFDYLETNSDVSLCYHKVESGNRKIDENIYKIKNDLSTAFIPTSSVVFVNKKEIVNKIKNHVVNIISADQYLFYLCTFIGKVELMDFVGGVYNQTENSISKSIGIHSKKWRINRILMYSTLLTISPMKNKVTLIKVAQNSLFNAMAYGIIDPFIKYPFHSLKIIIFGLIFYPRYTLYKGKSLLNNKW